MGERPLAEDPSRVLVALRLLAAVAAMKRRENTRDLGEKQDLNLKKFVQSSSFSLSCFQGHNLKVELWTAPRVENLCLRRARGDIIITTALSHVLLEHLNPYAILGTDL